jgi:chromosome segregation ATPase
MDLEIMKNTIFKSRVHKKGTILVIDDEKDVKSLISSGLARAVLTPAEAEIALDKALPAISQAELDALNKTLYEADQALGELTEKYNTLWKERDGLKSELETVTKERDLYIEEIAGLQADLAKASTPAAPPDGSPAAPDQGKAAKDKAKKE